MRISRCALIGGSGTVCLTEISGVSAHYLMPPFLSIFLIFLAKDLSRI
jgi:hypothetical protein